VREPHAASAAAEPGGPGVDHPAAPSTLSCSRN
jgi:hypothetical protein